MKRKKEVIVLDSFSFPIENDSPLLLKMKYIYSFVCLFAFSRATPAAYVGFQARGPNRAAAASLHQSHSNAGSEPRL